MELEKSETDVVSRLYALRGGLSALSVKYDQTRQIDGDFYEKLHTVADTAGGARYEAPQGTVEYANWLKGYGLENELNRRRNIAASRYVDDKKSNKVYKPPRDYRKTLIMMCVGLAFTVVFAVLAVIEITNFSALQERLYQIVGMFCALVAGILVVITVGVDLFAFAFFIYSLVCVVKDKKRFNKDKKDSLNRHAKISRENAKNNEQVANELKSIDSNTAKLPQVRKEAQKVLDERNAIVNSLVKYCNEYYKALLQEFNPLLDERDWKNLDLVIYELETRRADSVKEALQLVDRELQTERIERTIGEATKAICYTVARGFNELQSTVKICCDRICDRLDDISSQLDNVMALQAIQSIQLAGISGRLADLTDSVNVGNALQAKANETSAQLCSDAHALRYYS